MALQNKLPSLQNKLPNMEGLFIYKKVILISLILFGAIYVSYILSKSYRISSALYDMDNMSSYLLINSKLNLNEYKKAKLCDYYISTSFRPYMGKNQYFDYCDLSITEKIIKSGSRAMYVDIFNDTMGLNANPVLGTGIRDGQWKLSLNTIKFEDFCRLLSIACFNPGYVNNYDDPFILILNLNTNGNIYCLNKIHEYILKYLKTYLLSNKYTFSKVNISQEPIENFKKKIIILSSDGFKNSKLEEFINYSFKKPALKKISYEALIQTEKQDDGEMLSTHIDESSNVLKIDGNILKNYNKQNLTLVTPTESTIFTYNYDPTYFFETGCQFVAINYQLVDSDLDTYLTKFKTDSFVLKPSILRGAKVSKNTNSNLLGDSVNTGNSTVINNDVKLCPEAPSEDIFDGEDMITYKDDNSNVGLCFYRDIEASCNCTYDKSKNPKCNPSLYSEKTLIINSEYKNFCCSNSKINDPSPISNSDKPYYKYYFSNNEEDSENDKISLDMKDSTDSFYPVKINSNSELENKRICLLDVNYNTKKCPNGWNHTSSLNNGENICCKTT